MTEQGNFVKLPPFVKEPKGNLGSCSDDDHRVTLKQTNDIVAFVALESVVVAAVVANLNCAAGDVAVQD